MQTAAADLILRSHDHYVVQAQYPHSQQHDQPSSSRSEGGRFSRRRLISPFSSVNSEPLEDQLETVSSSASAAEDAAPCSSAVTAQDQPSLSTQMSFNTVCNQVIQACRLS